MCECPSPSFSPAILLSQVVADADMAGLDPKVSMPTGDGAGLCSTTCLGTCRSSPRASTSSIRGIARSGVGVAGVGGGDESRPALPCWLLAFQSLLCIQAWGQGGGSWHPPPSLGHWRVEGVPVDFADPRLPAGAASWTGHCYLSLPFPEVLAPRDPEERGVFSQVQHSRAVPMGLFL